jgi:hypothetical protein
LEAVVVPTRRPKDGLRVSFQKINSESGLRFLVAK